MTPSRRQTDVRLERYEASMANMSEIPAHPEQRQLGTSGQEVKQRRRQLVLLSETGRRCEVQENCPKRMRRCCFWHDANSNRFLLSSSTSHFRIPSKKAPGPQQIHLASLPGNKAARHVGCRTGKAAKGKPPLKKTTINRIKNVAFTSKMKRKKEKKKTFNRSD